MVQILTSYPALHRVGYDFDKETVRVLVYRGLRFKNLYYNIEKKSQ